MPKLASLPMQFSAGDGKAFTRAFNAFYSPLCFFAARLLKDAPAAQDVVADVFERFWRQGGNYESCEKIKAWFYITTRNACFNYLKRHTRLTGVLSDYGKCSESEEAVFLEITRSDAIDKVFALVEELPRECKRIMKLAFFEGYSNDAIAAMLRLSVHTVKNQKARGVMQMRTKIVRLELFGLLAFFPIFLD